jgi:hypothetical protein
MWRNQSACGRAATATVAYVIVCVAAAWLHGLVGRVSDAENVGESAQSEVSELRDRLDETVTDLEQLREELESLQTEVALR